MHLKHWLENLFPRYRFIRHRRRQSRNRTRPSVQAEQLETRMLLSAAALNDGEGVLEVVQHSDVLTGSR